MLRFLLVLSFFIFSFPLKADEFDGLKPKIKATWFNYLRNKTKETVYVGTYKLNKNNDDVVSPGTRKFVHVKAGNDSMTFIYDDNYNIKFSTTDRFILDDWDRVYPYFIFVEWKGGNPESIKNCIHTQINDTNDWGFSVDYWGAGNKNTNIYRYEPDGELITNPENDPLCVRLFEATKKYNPFK